MQTLKIPIHNLSNEEKLLIEDYQRECSSCLHILYNQIRDNNITKHQSKHLNYSHLDKMDAWFVLSCYKEAEQINKTNPNEKVIFGGRKNFFNRMKGLITKDEFKKKRLSPLYSIGDKNTKGNRKFQIIDNQTVLFKPKYGIKVNLQLKLNSKNWKNILDKLRVLQDLNEIPISYKLTTDYVAITFDESKLKENIDYKPVKNRFFSIDLNPNYIGYSVVEWNNEDTYEVLTHGVMSLKELNDKEKEVGKQDSYYSNKRNFEVFEISKKLTQIAQGFNCFGFAIEKLNIKTKSLGKGKKLNRLLNNQWNRAKLQKNIEKRRNLIGIKYIEVLSQYSSFIGNLVYRDTKLPDMVLSSIEISRRAYEFNLQYIEKSKAKKENIIFLELTDKIKESIQKSLEELEIALSWKTLKELYEYLKNSKCRYRVSFEDDSGVLRRFRYKHLRNLNVF